VLTLSFIVPLKSQPMALIIVCPGYGGI